MAKPSDASSRELDASIDALYQVPLDRFTAERNALAAALKKNGDKDAAEYVKGLTKPSTTAWAVNQVWWRHRDRFQAMLEAGAAQRKAHLAYAQGRKVDVRAAGEARRQAVREVAEAALEALGGQRAVAPDVQYRILGTVEAMASSGVPEGETPGRLTRDLQSSGLDALTALAEAAAQVQRPTIVARGTPGPRKAAPEMPVAGGAGHATARPAAQPATQTARERKARDQAEAAARAQAEQVARARARVDELTTGLDAATEAAESATAAERTARAALEAASKARAALEEALDEARSEEAARRREVSERTAAASRAELDRARAARDLARAREALDRLAPKDA